MRDEIDLAAKQYTMEKEVMDLLDVLPKIPPSPSVDPNWYWNKDRLMAAYLIAFTKYPYAKIAEIVGVARSGMGIWRSSSDFKSYVALLQTTVGHGDIGERLRLKRQKMMKLEKVLDVKFDDVTTPDKESLSGLIKNYEILSNSIAKDADLARSLYAPRAQGTDMAAETIHEHIDNIENPQEKEIVRRHFLLISEEYAHKRRELAGGKTDENSAEKKQDNIQPEDGQDEKQAEGQHADAVHSNGSAAEPSVALDFESSESDADGSDSGVISDLRSPARDPLLEAISGPVVEGFEEI